MSSSSPTFQRWKPFFQKAASSVPPYLHLLNAHDPAHTAASVRVLLLCLQDSPSPEADITDFLQQHNWRFHIAAAVALVCGLRSPSLFSALWASLRSGSWASPQLAAAAFLSDPDFLTLAPRYLFTAQVIMGEGAKTLPPLGGLPLDPLPPSSALTSKGIAALALLYPKLSLPDPTILAAIHSPPMQTVLDEEDMIDAGGQIAVGWAERLTPFVGCLQAL